MPHRTPNSKPALVQRFVVPPVTAIAVSIPPIPIPIEIPTIAVPVPTRIVALHVKPGVNGGHAYEQDCPTHEESDIGNGSGRRDGGGDGFVGVFIEEATIIGSGGRLGGEAGGFDLIVRGRFRRVFRGSAPVLRVASVASIRTRVRLCVTAGPAGPGSEVGAIAAGGGAGFIGGFTRGRGRRFCGDFEVGAVAGVVVCGGEVEAVGTSGEIAWDVDRSRR